MQEQFDKETVDFIKKIKVPKEFNKFDSGIIPLGKSVLLTRVKNGERKSEGGLIIPDAVGTTEYTARIVATGPECSPYLKPGLLVIYNSMANLESIIKGKNYLCCHESSIFYILHDEDVKVTAAPKSSEETRKDEKIKKQTSTLDRVKKHTDNKEDKYTEGLKKKKIFPKTRFGK